METSLHRELKRLYAGEQAQTEVRLGQYRIDAVTADGLVEIQHGSLAAIRDKVRRLLDMRRVLVVKPIVARKRIVRCDSAGQALSERLSPKRGDLLSIFDELVYFTRVFPHRRLTLEVVLVEVEEHRVPGHGRRRRWRRDDHVVLDQRLTSVGDSVRLQTTADLVALLPASLPKRFHTGDLARLCEVRRHVAQRIAYALRETGAITAVGKERNSWLYEVAAKARRAKRRRAA